MRILADSAIEITSLSPAQANATAFPPPDYSNVTPPCDSSDPACLIEHFDGHEPEKICEVFGVHFPECADLINAAANALRPPPVEFHPRTFEILMADPVISELVGDGQQNVDYWLNLSPFRDPGHGDASGEVAGATFVFAEPVSWRGMIRVASQPCSPYWSEGYIEPGHFCLDIEREFTETFTVLDEVRILPAMIYARHGFVTNHFVEGDITERKLERMIEQFSEYEYD